MNLFKPKGSASLRPPTSDAQNHGQVVNPPRYAHLGGLTSAGKVSKGKMGLSLESKKPGKSVI